MRRFLALSRSTHGVLELAMPGFVALLWLGRFPPWQLLALCLCTALAGYTAIYALNDLVGVIDDREKVAGGIKPGYAVEASAMRYPLAQNLISMKAGLAWFGVWFSVAILGAWLINPAILVIVFGAAVLEVAYVKLLRVTWWRTVVSGLVKSAGPVAAVYAVIPDPSWPELALMLLWLMPWEIGGQNIPADWNDIEEDRSVGAHTIPLVFGPRVASILVPFALLLTVITSAFLPTLSPLDRGPLLRLAILATGMVFLLFPSVRLALTRDGRDAARLFDYASFYPSALLVILALFIILQ